METSEWQRGYDEGYDSGYDDGRDDYYTSYEDKICDECTDLQLEIDRLYDELRSKKPSPTFTEKITDLIRKYKNTDLSKNEALSQLENELDIFPLCGV